MSTASRPATPETAAQLIVLAKEPIPGRVKTRLCPPCTPEQAAGLAAAALADTVTTVNAAPAAARTLVVSGRYQPPPGWRRVDQRGNGLGSRLAHAYRATALAGAPSLLVGMDTPQLTPSLLREAAAALTARGIDAALGEAEDGGWWTLGLRDPRHGDLLRWIPMSTRHTGEETLAALRRRGLRVALLPVLRDVDTAEDAQAVARLCPASSRFARAVTACLGTAAAT